MGYDMRYFGLGLINWLVRPQLSLLFSTDSWHTLVLRLALLSLLFLLFHLTSFFISPTASPITNPVDEDDDDDELHCRVPYHRGTDTTDHHVYIIVDYVDVDDDDGIDVEVEDEDRHDGTGGRGRSAHYCYNSSQVEAEVRSGAGENSGLGGSNNIIEDNEGDNNEGDNEHYDRGDNVPDAGDGQSSELRRRRVHCDHNDEAVPDTRDRHDMYSVLHCAVQYDRDRNREVSTSTTGDHVRLDIDYHCDRKVHGSAVRQHHGKVFYVRYLWVEFGYGQWSLLVTTALVLSLLCPSPVFQYIHPWIILASLCPSFSLTFLRQFFHRLRAALAVAASASSPENGDSMV